MRDEMIISAVESTPIDDWRSITARPKRANVQRPGLWLRVIRKAVIRFGLYRIAARMCALDMREVLASGQRVAVLSPHSSKITVLAITPYKFRGDRKSTRLNSSHSDRSRMPSSA